MVTTRAKKATAKAEPVVEEKKARSPRNEAYSAAERRLREKHPDDFQTFLQEETEARGLEYKRRLTPEERAEKLRQERIAAARKKAQEAQAVLEALGASDEDEQPLPFDGETDADPLA